jgi:hypothetical protein
LAVVSCTGDSPETGGNPPGLSGTCGLPTPDPGRDESLVPELLLPEGAEVSNAQAERGGFIAAINVKLSVGDALAFYRDAVKKGGYEVINIDNEGFEAEMYLRRKAKNKLAAIQIRTSTCDDRSIVFINEIVPQDA